jgi:AcrR family transcriptional regulator
MRLHGTVGPANTTVSAIAAEAGVQRATVYRHFADQQALFDACSARFNEVHPRPDIAAWAAIADPVRRLATALDQLYAWYGLTGDMLAKIQRDREHLPPRQQTAWRAFFQEAGDVLLRGRPERGRAREQVAAAIGHALAFHTWRSLVEEQGLDDAEAAALMTRMVACAPEPGR